MGLWVVSPPARLASSVPFLQLFVLAMTCMFDLEFLRSLDYLKRIKITNRRRQGAKIETEAEEDVSMAS